MLYRSRPLCRRMLANSCHGRTRCRSVFARTGPARKSRILRLKETPIPLAVATVLQGRFGNGVRSASHEGVAHLLFPRAPRSDASLAAAGPVSTHARVDPDGQVLLGNESGQQRD